MNPVHTLTHPPSKIHFNIIILYRLRFPSWCLPLRLPDQNVVSTSHLSHTYYMSRPSHLPRFNHYNIWWRVQIGKLLIVKLSPSTYHFFLLRPNILLCTLKYPERLLPWISLPVHSPFCCLSITCLRGTDGTRVTFIGRCHYGTRMC
jgi:hypothetical protein